MNSKLILIRHGITEGNLKKWFYGSTDIPLTEEGTIELRRLKEKGCYPIVPDDTQFVISGLLRTKQTLNILYGDKDYIEVPEIKEMNFGDFECNSYEDIKENPDFDKWVWDKTGEVETKNGESRNQFSVRVWEGLKKVINLHRLKELSHRHSGKDAITVAVCHGGVISVMMEKMFPGEKKTMWDWIPDPGSGYIIDIKGGNPQTFQGIWGDAPKCSSGELSDKE